MADSIQEEVIPKITDKITDSHKVLAQDMSQLLSDISARFAVIETYQEFKQLIDDMDSISNELEEKHRGGMDEVTRIINQ